MQSSESNFLLVVEGDLADALEVCEDDSNISCSGSDLAPLQPEEQREGRIWCPLMEIYSIRFLTEEEDGLLPHIYGVIAIEGSSGISILFNRKVGDPSLVNSEGLVKFPGMRRALKVQGDILIKPCVFCTKYIVLNNKPPSNLWRAGSNKWQYDKLLVTKIRTSLGPIEVQYAVYKEATEAIVDITVDDVISERATNFNGTIKAWNTQVTGAICNLFEDNISVNFGSNESAGLSLHLSRSAVVVPCKSSLIVSVDIHHETAIFAATTIEFPARLSGEDVQTLPGIGGLIVVKVTWLASDCSSEAQGCVVGRISDNIQNQLCDSSSRHFDMDHLDDPCKSSLSFRDDVFGGDRHIAGCAMKPDGTYYDQKLLELFSVRFVNHEKFDANNIYGTIMIDVDSNFILYNRKLGDPPCIDSEGFITLRAPIHGMEVAYRIELYHYLFDLEMMPSSEHLPWWGEVGNGCIGEGNLVFDQVLSQQMDSKFGPIEVTFAVYYPGVEATLDVTLINFGEECLPEVYGHVKVKNDKICDPRAVSWLFKKENKDAASCITHSMSEGCIALPLLRHAVVVPLHSTMMVDMCICYGDTIVASGEVMFHSKLTGKESGFLTGSHGKIEVEVSWSLIKYGEILGYCW